VFLTVSILRSCTIIDPDMSQPKFDVFMVLAETFLVSPVRLLYANEV